MARIVRDLQRHVEATELMYRNRIDRLMKIAAEEMLANMDRQVDPDGNPWDELSPDYAAWKAKHYPGEPMAVLFGILKRLDNLRGVPTVAARRAVQTFGYATDSSRQEATWFIEGDPAQNRPPRNFWGFTARAIERLNDETERDFRRSI